MDLQPGRDYQFGPFRLSVSDRLLYRDQQLIHLPPKVFDTLLILAAHSGHVVSKEVMMGQLWPDSFVEEGTLTQYISMLRKALGEHGTWIENLPRRGYRFTEPVLLVPEALVPEAAPESPAAEMPPANQRRPMPRLLLIPAVMVVIAGVMLGLKYLPTGSEAAGPTEAEALVLRARGLLASGPSAADLQTAAAVLDQAIQSDPNSAEAHGWLAYTQAFQYREALVGIDTLRAATSHVNQALARDPASPSAARALVDIHHLSGRLTEALIVARTALENNPESTEITAAAGEAYFRTGLYERAIPLYQKALATQPENRWFRTQLARMYLFLGDHSKGLEMISSLPLSEVGPFGMVLYAVSGSMDKAVEVARTDRDTGLVGFFGFFRGCVLAGAGDRAGAERIWSEGVQLGESRSKEYQNAFLHVWMGQRYAELGDREKARRHLQKGLEIDPHNAVLLFFAAETEAILGDASAAARNLQAAAEGGFLNLPMVKFLTHPMFAFHAVRDDAEFKVVIAQMEHKLSDLRTRF